ncbi:hypothetical protein P700755_004032 [Psychroflexus torquis ATCC 700755]|uniref:Uncharacterized protein n=1 Tax=Psychroflexus torquis (strain ATCC 700755 / CIP 106069 / ACAM 623) TaxID=313595 RepID=K4IJ64_PSYTT|nr:hypothetical protein [Psychroflexus torquis]AFU70587.1 hypothetical protein P700755_004032 [Psychroflexus torquis ATCC 700755]
MILNVAILFVSCSSNNEGKTNNSLTEILVLKGVQYSSKSRQFLDLYKAESDCSTPVYFHAHGNDGSTYMLNSIIEDLNAQGTSVIAWESLTSVHTPSEVETGWNDVELMFEWVKIMLKNTSLTRLTLLSEALLAKVLSAANMDTNRAQVLKDFIFIMRFLMVFG